MKNDNFDQVKFDQVIVCLLNHLYQQTTVHLEIRNRCLDVSIKLSWVGLVLGLGIQSRFKKTVFQTSKSFNSSLFSLVGVRPRECIMRVELKIFQFSIFIPEQIKSSARFAMGSLVRETEKPSKIFFKQPLNNMSTFLFWAKLNLKLLHFLTVIVKNQNQLFIVSFASKTKIISIVVARFHLLYCCQVRI